MEKIADVTGVLCISVFVMGIFYQLGGFEKTSKVIRFIVALYIISTVFTSFEYFKYVPLEYDIFVDKDIYDYDVDFYNSVIYKTKINLEEIIKNRLDEKNISYENVSVHILEQNGAVIADEIEIDCKAGDTEAVYSCIDDMLTEDTKVIIGD